MKNRLLHPTTATLAIFFLALALRLVFGLLLHRPGDFIDSDMWVYDLRAENLRKGTLGPWDSFTPVGYPAFLALLYELSGRSLALVAVIQAFLGAVTAALAHLLALRITHHRGIALASGLAVTFHLPLVLYGGLLLSETLFTFLLVLGAWLLLRAAAQPSWQRAILAGLVLGAATVVRPNLLLFLPLIPIWAFFALQDRRQGLALSMRILAAVVPLLAAASIHNTRLVGKPTGLGTNGGLNFYLAHAEVKGITFQEGNFTHRIFPLPNLLRHERVEASTAPLYDESHFYGKAFALLREQPATLPRALWQNLRMGFNRAELHFWPGWPGHESLLERYGRLCFPLLLLPAILLLGALGGRLRRREESGRLLLALFLASAIATLVFFLPDPRMRVPFDVFFAILAADAFFRAAAWIRTRLQRDRVLAGA